jgi:hypothetical protein
VQQRQVLDPDAVRRIRRRGIGVHVPLAQQRIGERHICRRASQHRHRGIERHAVTASASLDRPRAAICASNGNGTVERHRPDLNRRIAGAPA